jgi:ferric-dicitrate binding protein FerR (iron transport regulator)
MNNQEFDRLVDSMRAAGTPEQARLAAGRVWERLADRKMHSTANLWRNCADFRAAIPYYLEGQLPEAKHLLFEDHVRGCVSCRKAIDAIEQAEPVMARPQPAFSWQTAAVQAGVAAAMILGLFFGLRNTMDEAMAPQGPRATVQSIGGGGLFRLAGGDSQSLAAGAVIGEDEVVRTGKDGGAIVTLRDGSRIEMNERTELRIEERWSGATVHLIRGDVVVEAAKQKRGELKVSTADVRVAVKGTIFAVRAGGRGSRVAVVEGAVKVAQGDTEKLLAPGERGGTDSSPATVADDVAWSQNRARYIALLGEIKSLAKDIQALPAQPLRYQSKLAARLPRTTVMYAAAPNLSSTLDQALKLFEGRVASSDVLRAWWNEKETQEVQRAVAAVRDVTRELGDEIVIAALQNNNEPLAFVIAELKPNANRDVLTRELSKLPEGAYTLDADTLVLAGGKSDFARIRAAGAGFDQSPLFGAIQQSYSKGAGWLFAADLKPLLAGAKRPGEMLGFENLDHLIVESRESQGQPDLRASVHFTGARTGLPSWLAEPGPVGSLEFVSPDAAFATGGVLRNPRQMLDELLMLSPQLKSAIADTESKLGAPIINDLASALGGEFALALDGALVPTPSILAVAECLNPARFESTLEQVAARVNQHGAPEADRTGRLLHEHASIDGRAWHLLRFEKLPFELHYTFEGGYWIAGVNRGMVEKAIRNRAAGVTLPRSQAFRSRLPAANSPHYSSAVFYNLGSKLGAAGQFAGGGKLDESSRKTIDFLSQSDPVLIVTYGESNQITVASTSGFLGMGIDALLDAAAGEAMLPRILPRLGKQD